MSWVSEDPRVPIGRKADDLTLSNVGQGFLDHLVVRLNAGFPLPVVRMQRLCSLGVESLNEFFRDGIADDVEHFIRPFDPGDGFHSHLPNRAYSSADYDQLLIKHCFLVPAFFGPRTGLDFICNRATTWDR